jgi:hypothetical protein
VTHSQLQQALGIDPDQAARVPPWNLSSTLQKAQKADTIKYLVREGLLVRDDFPDDVSQLMSGVWAGQRCVEQNETGVRQRVVSMMMVILRGSRVTCTGYICNCARKALLDTLVLIAPFALHPVQLSLSPRLVNRSETC